MTRISLVLALLASLQPGIARARCSMAHATVLAERCGAMDVPAATRHATFSGNLSADATVRQTGFVADGTYASAYRSASFPMTFAVVDAAGQKHDLLLFFTRTGPASFTVDTAVDAADTGASAGTLVAVAQEQMLRFGATGRLRSRRRLGVVLPWAGGTTQRIVVDLASMTMRPGPSGIDCLAQDGCALAP